MTSYQAFAGEHVAMLRPAGFWRRVLALTVDTVIVGGLVALLGVLAYAPTGGAIRIGDIPNLSTETCRSADLEQYAVNVPADFTATQTEVCTLAAFGVVHDTWLELRDIQSSGSWTFTRYLVFPLSPDGRLNAPLYLDYVAALLLAIYLLLCEWRFGTSLGKLVMGIWVRPLKGGALAFAACCRRLLRFAPLVPLAGLMIVMQTSNPITQWTLWTTYNEIYIALVVLTVAGEVLLLGNFVVALLKDDLPWHDRWAKAEVVTAR